MHRSRTVAVAGAGIGGLATALALAREGFRVVVAERAPYLSEAGAGIQIAPNAGRILADLGLDSAIAAVAAEPEAIDIRAGRSGRRIVSMPLGARLTKRGGIPYRTIHRGDLQAVLAAAVAGSADIDLILGAEVVEFAGHAHGITVMLEHGDGRAGDIGAIALVAADGLRSRIRAAMPGRQGPQPLGRAAWRAVLDAAEAPPVMATDRIGLWLSADAHLVHYPVRGGRQINIVAIVGQALSDTGWDLPADRSWIADRFRRWSEPVRRIVAAPREWRRWSLSTVDPAGSWALGPVALLGDAAHAMPPFLAQGGAMAIEDAAVLAKVLADRPDDPAAAFQRYEALRKPRVRRVFRASRSAGDLYHMGALTGAIRNLGMRSLGGRSLAARYDWIYRWKAA